MDSVCPVVKYVRNWKGTELEFDRSSLVVNWKDTGSSLTWNFAVSQPGQFAVSLSTAAFARPRIWKGGHTVEISVGDQVISDVIKKDLELDSPRTKHFPEAESMLGTIRILEPGIYSLTMRVTGFNPEIEHGIAISYIRLEAQNE